MLLSIVEHLSHFIGAGTGAGADTPEAGAEADARVVGVDVFCCVKNCVIRGVVANDFDLSRRFDDLFVRGVEMVTIGAAVVSTADAATTFEPNKLLLIFELTLVGVNLVVSFLFGVLLIV